MTTKPETTPQSDRTAAAMSGTQADIVDLLRLHSHQQAMIPSNMMRLAADEIERLRDQLAAMHRRAWQAEAALREPLDAAAPERRTLGRVLANAGYYAERGRAENAEARIAELEAIVAYVAGTNTDPVQVAMAGNPNVCDRIVERARALLKGADE